MGAPRDPTRAHAPPRLFADLARAAAFGASRGDKPVFARADERITASEPAAAPSKRVRADCRRPAGQAGRQRAF
jgi:hypothetical protein